MGRAGEACEIDSRFAPTKRQYGVPIDRRSFDRSGADVLRHQCCDLCSAGRVGVAFYGGLVTLLSNAKAVFLVREEESQRPFEFIDSTRHCEVNTWLEWALLRERFREYERSAPQGLEDAGFRVEMILSVDVEYDLTPVVQPHHL